jgi:hypothetical protein
MITVVSDKMIFVVSDKMIFVVSDKMIFVVSDKMISVVADIRRSSGAGRVGLGGLAFSLGMPGVVFRLVPCGSGRDTRRKFWGGIGSSSQSGGMLLGSSLQLLLMGGLQGQLDLSLLARWHEISE